MKFLIVFAACVALVTADLTAENMEFVRSSASACADQKSIGIDQLQGLISGNFENADKCFVNCFLEKLGVIADGQIKPDIVLQTIGPIAGVDKIKAAQAKCDSLKGSDKCETAVQLYHCYFQNGIKI